MPLRPLRPLAVLAALALVAGCGEPRGSAAPPAAHGLRVAPLPFDYPAALSLCVDDPTPAEIDALLPLLSDRERPIRATVAVDPRRFADAPARERLRALHAAGDEIALWHAQGDPATALAELRAALPEIPCSTIAGPAEAPPAPEGILAARGRGGGTLATLDGADPLRLPDLHLARGSAAALDAVIRSAIGARGWAILTWGERGNDLAAQLEAVLDHHHELWDAPIRDVLAYRASARGALVEVVERGDERIVLRLADGLPRDVHRVALTLAMPAPAGWARFAATQAGRAIWHGVVRGEARFNAVPGAGDIVLARLP